MLGEITPNSHSCRRALGQGACCSNEARQAEAHPAHAEVDARYQDAHPDQHCRDHAPTSVWTVRDLSRDHPAEEDRHKPGDDGPDAAPEPQTRGRLTCCRPWVTEC